MDQYFILIGGGEIKSKETLPIDTEICSFARRLFPDKRPFALFVGTASHDFMPYYNSFHKTYTGVLDVKTDVALSVYRTSTDVEGKFAKADIIYVGGGDTPFLVEKWGETGYKEFILDAQKRGAIVCGLSAGAICWFDKMFTDAGRDGDHEYHVTKGLGVLPGNACPHANLRGAELIQYVAEGESWYCLSDNSAIVFKNGALIGSIGDGDAYVLSKAHGELKKENIAKTQL